MSDRPTALAGGRQARGREAGGGKSGRWLRVRLAWIVAAVAALITAVIVSATGQASHARATALPDPADQAPPVGAALGPKLADISGHGTVSRRLASAPTVFVSYVCEGRGSVTIVVLGKVTSGQCFAAQPVEYGATLVGRLVSSGGVVEVSAPTGVRWRVLVHAVEGS